MVDNKIMEESYQMSIEAVRNQIIDLHKNVKLCIDLEFAKDPSDILPFDDIIVMCAGDNFAVVLRYYEELTFAVKEVIKEKIKLGLKAGFCNNMLFACIQYFKTLNLFIDLDYDLLKSIDFSVNELQRKIAKDKLQTLIGVTKTQVGDYEALRQHMLDERSYLSSYFNEQKELYQAKYANVTIVKEDNLIDDSHVNNANEELTTIVNPDAAKIDTSFMDKVLQGGSDLKAQLMSYINNR